MVYRIDNRPKKHGKTLVLGIVIGIGIAIGGVYWFENTPKLMKIAGDAENSATNVVNTIGKSNPVQTNPTDLKSVALQIHNLVNAERVRNGLSPLAWNEGIAQVATLYSQYMLINNNYNHVDLNGNHANARMSKAGINCGTNWAENLDWVGGGTTTFTPDNILSDWMGDSGHKDNLLNPNVTSEGIGIFTDGKQTYITEDFCTSLP